MAYGRPLDVECYQDGCTKRATFEVLNQWNAPVGKYCRPHADALVRRLSAAEDAARDRARPK